MGNILASTFLTVVPIRAAASHRSEIISQILFGECFEVLEKEDDWVKIKNLYDDYEGWTDEKQIVYLDSEYQKTEHFDIKLSNCFGVAVIKNQTDNKTFLPLGASLPINKQGKVEIAQHIYDLESSHHIIQTDVSTFKEHVLDIAKQFIDVPYLWGGRTHFGIDCSGFSQIVYKVCGIKIKRDAWQQAEQGKLVAFLSQAQTGDLAFFDNEEGKITHVGIMINNNLIIHASGRVKIDLIDDQGIFSSDLKRYSHKLRIIKRYI